MAQPDDDKLWDWGCSTEPPDPALAQVAEAMGRAAGRWADDVVMRATMATTMEQLDEAREKVRVALEARRAGMRYVGLAGRGSLHIDSYIDEVRAEIEQLLARHWGEIGLR